MAKLSQSSKLYFWWAYCVSLHLLYSQMYLDPFLSTYNDILTILRFQFCGSKLGKALFCSTMTIPCAQSQIHKEIISSLAWKSLTDPDRTLTWTPSNTFGMNGNALSLTISMLLWPQQVPKSGVKVIISKWMSLVLRCLTQSQMSVCSGPHTFGNVVGYDYVTTVSLHRSGWGIGTFIGNLMYDVFSIIT